MNKVFKILVISAGALIVFGAVIMGIAYLLGGRGGNVDGIFEKYFSFGSGSVLRYKDNFTNDYSEDGSYSVSADGIKSVSIDWIAGEVTLKEGNGNTINFTETSKKAITKDNALRWGVRDGTLYIRYCRSGRVHVNTKNLELYIPKSLMGDMENFEFAATSANLNADKIKANKVKTFTTSGDVRMSCEADTVKTESTSGDITMTADCTTASFCATSGDISFDGSAKKVSVNCTSGGVAVRGTVDSADIACTSGTIAVEGSVGELEASSLSGKIVVNGKAEELDLGTTSGGVSLDLDKCPRELEVSSVSGGVRITLPEDSDFALEFSSVSGNFDSDLAVKKQGGKYVCGNGDASFDVSTTSGSLKIIGK